MSSEEAPLPFRVRVVQHRSRGRELQAEAALGRGDVALRSLPLALVPSDAHLTSRCAACLSSVTQAVPCACGYVLCGACSEDARWRAVHAAGECVSLRHLWKLLQRAPGGAESLADSAAARLLIRLAYVRFAERAGDLPQAACPGEGETLSDESDALDDLVSHFDELTDAQQAHAADAAATVRWCLLPCARQSRERLAHTAARLWCNSFDVVDAESGESVGEGVYPSLALALNHDCAPNADFQLEEHNAGAIVVRTLRPVAKGEVRIPWNRALHQPRVLNAR